MEHLKNINSILEHEDVLGNYTFEDSNFNSDLREIIGMLNIRHTPTISAANGLAPISLLFENINFITSLRESILDISHRINKENDNNGLNTIQIRNSDRPIFSDHRYLGFNMTRVSGVNYLKDGNEAQVLMFMHVHIILPGETIPFTIDKTVIESLLKAQKGILIGICFPFLRATENDDYIFGVTCQVYEVGIEQLGICAVKARGLQRFITRLVDLPSDLEFLASQPIKKCYGIIKILPEIYLCDPQKFMNMGSMCRFRENCSVGNIYKRFQMSTTPLPSYIFDSYSISAIIEKARIQLSKFKIYGMPQDPTKLSFWLARNFHMSEDVMSQIFMTNSVNLRLKLIFDTFKEDAIFICRFCSNQIAKCSELFGLSEHGVQAQYYSSSGFIHEVNTVNNILHKGILIRNVELNNDYNWFPGYQWRIIVCKECTRDVGWEFKSVNRNSHVHKFFGLSSLSVRVSEQNCLPSHPSAVIYRYLMHLTELSPVFNESSNL